MKMMVISMLISTLQDLKINLQLKQNQKRV